MLQIKNALLDVKSFLEASLQVIDSLMQDDAAMQIMLAEVRGNLIRSVRQIDGKLYILQQEETPPTDAPPLTKLFGKIIEPVKVEKIPTDEP